MTSNEGTTLDVASPANDRGGILVSLTPPLLADSEKGYGSKKRTEAEFMIEDAEESDVLTPALESPSTLVNPDWSIIPPLSSNSPSLSTSPALKKTKASHISSRVANNAANAPAAKSRPLYQDRVNSNGSPSSDGISTQASRDALRRKLMPAIPTRKESVNSIYGENTPGASKSSTNIQTLAQAIAARAQHVAAANAMARAGMYPKSSASATTSTSAPPLLSTVKVEADKASPPKATSNDEDGIPTSAAALARHAASIKSSEKATGDSASDSLVLAMAGKIDGNSRDSTSSSRSRDSYRWSKLDSRTSREEAKEPTSTEDYDTNITSVDKSSFTNSSEHSGGSTKTSQIDTTIDDRSRQSVSAKRSSNQSRSSATSLEVPSTGDSSVAKATKSIVSGLGIVGGSDVFVHDHTESIPSFKVPNRSSQTYATASEGTQQDLLDSHLPSNSNVSSSPPLSTTSSSHITSRRGSKPSALTLNTNTPPMISTKSISTASLAKSLASPVLRSKTPPPTLPPAEPLPPVPATPSSVYKHRSMSKGSHGSSPRTESDTLHTSNPLMAAFAALASSPPQNQHHFVVENESTSSNTSSHVAKMRSESQETASSVLRRRSLKTSSTSARDSNAARALAEAMVNANHAFTIAGAQSAEEVLKRVAAEPSYDQKRASTFASAKKSGTAGDLVPSNTSHTGNTTFGPDEASSVNADKLAIGIDQDDDGDDDDDEFEEAEEAIVTKVVSVNASAALTNISAARLIGKESAPTIRSNAMPVRSSTASSSAEDVAKLARANSVTKMRALFESRASNKVDGENRNVTRKSINPRTSAGDEVTSSERIASPRMESPQASGMGVATPDFYTQLTATATMNLRDSLEGNTSNASTSPIQGRRMEGKSLGSYVEIAAAFKRLQAEKKLLEKVIRSTTPLSGIGDGEDLSQYLILLTSKLDLSAQEIRRLLDLLDQQRSVMDYMSDTHQLQLNACDTEIEDLNQEIEEVMTESDTHRMNCIRLTEDLDRAHADIIAANADALRFKNMLVEEEGRRQGYENLLHRAREEVQRVTSERDNMIRGDNGSNRGFNGGALLGNVPRSPHFNTVTLDHTADEITEELKKLRSEKMEYEREVATLRAKVESLELSSGEIANGSRRASNDTWTEEKSSNQGDSRDIKRNLNDEDRLNPLRSHDEMSTGSLSPLITGPTEVEDALRDKLIQQEKDIAELRATVALGGGMGSNGTTDVDGQSAVMTILASGRANQVEILLADLAEKRAREAQIRIAYKQLRDEMRKMQLAQQQDRKRASFTYLAAGSVSPVSSSHGHGIITNGTTATNAYRASTIGAPSSWLGVSNSPSDLSNGTSPRATSRQLKRLSLPLVSKTLGNGGASANTASILTSSADNSESPTIHYNDTLNRKNNRNSSLEGQRFLGINRSLSVSNRQRGEESSSRIPVLARKRHNHAEGGEVVESLITPT